MPSNDITKLLKLETKRYKYEIIHKNNYKRN